jgi:hypothetical protein
MRHLTLRSEYLLVADGKRQVSAVSTGCRLQVRVGQALRPASRKHRAVTPGKQIGGLLVTADCWLMVAGLA